MTNKETKYTPGPWNIKDKTSANVQGHKNKMSFLSIEIPAAGGGGIALVSYNTCGNANAHLIAAAPDLLEALENIMNGIQTRAVRIETDQDETWENAMHKAKKVIAKAKGENEK